MPRKLTDAEWRQKVAELGEGVYVCIGEYVNTSTKVLMRHDACGHEYETTPLNFVQGRRCPNCASKGKRPGAQLTLTIEDFQARLDETHGRGVLTAFGEFRDTQHPVSLRCQEGHEWTVKRASEAVRQGASGCPACNLHPHKMTHDEFIQRLAEAEEGDEYTVLTAFHTVLHAIQLRHSCGHEYWVKPNRFLQGDRCPRCAAFRKSKNERMAARFLDELGLEYKHEARFRELPSPISPRFHLSFDFWIPALRLLVEIDGEFHRMPHASAVGQQSLERQQLRDRVKDEWAASRADIILCRVNTDEMNGREGMAAAIQEAVHWLASTDVVPCQLTLL